MENVENMEKTQRHKGTESWPMVRLGDVCEEVRERIPSSKITSANYVTTDNMIKGCGGVRFENNAPPDVGLVSYRPGDVLVSNIRPYLRKSWLSDRLGGCSSDVIVFRAIRKDLSASYLYAALSSDAFFDYSMQNVSGTKMPRGKRDWIKKFSFPLPPLSVQREIVGRLEKELGNADELAAKSKRLGELADELFKSELDAAFKNVKGEKVRLGDVCETCSGGTPLKSRREYYDGGKIPWLRSGEVCRMNIDKTELFITKKGVECSSAKMVPSNSVAVAMYGATAGQVGILRISLTTNQAICVILPNENYEPEFLYYQLVDLKDVIVDGAQGDAQPNSSQIKIKNLAISLPSISAQREIVVRLDAARERSENLKAAAERGAALAAELRKSILQEAFA